MNLGKLFCCAALLAALSVNALPQPKSRTRANHTRPVTVTLVRWPYT
ncbi:MAG TPA: hypothetical protein PKC13_29550 [Blastocatellia bacterium]|nr:hypothetical protein [Blastocatellia bacterium]